MQKLVLIGGGHSHAIALKMCADNPLKNVKIVLINDVEKTPYSGMLPGYIAGYYTIEQTHIDLQKLAKKSQTKLIIDQVIDINTTQNTVTCSSGKIIPYDFLSIDIGSTPDKSNIKGAKEYATPAKPVPTLLEKWHNILDNCRQKPQENITLNIIGGGAGGVELALNMRQQLINIIDQEKVTINIINRGSKILSQHNQTASNIFHNLLIDKKINLYLNTEIVQILPHKIISAQSKEIRGNYHFLVTNSSPAPWLQKTNLSLDKKGFILVKNTLQTLSHDNIFATGDIATIQNYPRPKAGVFAVKQGKPLYNNWRLLLKYQKPQPYHPQSLYLSLIGTGDKKAVAIWGDFAWLSRFFWFFKNYIDQKFMQQF
ncbi:pyridine nucleotide-disulfide oxidoreductase family protein [Cyanobacterium stanieri PCC 7202]|uniref:Pyridine nucleotide-disulfide oxidoreductase family protein n=1 Tax=Cyanobacterium stanieri (strain ATCC 29140 / PCC 7202) TaxID=292563 RepID=K9YMF3_CYASC|nr:pyridine nucleotide-disulfide oxidoreductase family protein [Cyanobacterium stanieri PCC 7202]